MNDLETFKTLLEQMDPVEMAQHSTINHHVDGMQYLCLHRSPKLTAKIYLIEQPTNPNSGFLVHPHSHRYPFSSVVLAGQLEHIRFLEMDGASWVRYSYRAESRQRLYDRACGLLVHRIEPHHRGSSYFVQPYEIHTLRMITEPAKPVMIGLMQFADTQPTSELYLPDGMDEVAYPQSRQPTAIEAFALRNRCLELLK
ncbi:hypothetical protein [Bordetella phage vB_BbrM_PHB04]|uniref:Uncharacterized protein n=1 Tax=Bordetella phage vB_BbrM_PHB04 TaxID=2029657 RepID=A0A291LA03_9CAUD|nr:hypothetical protein HOS14_gp093 [Bordetella phage vB_BbrM_PHB04]ATI15711.1 hypothetical protein [Bordetella phage vB_BbrM_PHB04]